jgi:hypothetical protein
MASINCNATNMRSIEINKYYSQYNIIIELNQSKLISFKNLKLIDNIKAQNFFYLKKGVYNKKILNFRVLPEMCIIKLKQY